MASAALLCSGTAFAQEATPQANDQTGSATEALAEDIVVTATKKGYGESVQKVPMAVTAFGEAQLDAKFVQNLQSLRVGFETHADRASLRIMSSAAAA